MRIRLTQPRRAGVLERAHGGTLLLDEVSDMPLETQGKIVRALQDQTFERLGGSARVKVDVRVLVDHQPGPAGGDRARGRFREDLYYRLAVVPLRVPALRERREDVPRAGAAVPRALGRDVAGCRRGSCRPTRWQRCRPMTGPATCVSCAI